MSSSNPPKPVHGGYAPSNGASVVPLGSPATVNGTSHSTTYTIGPGVSNSYITAPGVHGVVAAPPSNSAHWSASTTDTLRITFLEMEHGVLVKAVLEPDANLQPLEGLRIQLLVANLTGPTPVVGFKPITYIRQHNLERHFRFSS